MTKKYVEFKLVAEKPKTNVYHVRAKSSGEYLGRVAWYFPWRQYVFEPATATIWSRGCLMEVITFIEKLMEERKHG